MLPKPTNEHNKIALIKKLLQNGLDSIFDDLDKHLFNPLYHAQSIGRFDKEHPSHNMVGVGEPGTMGWEGYACNKCWAREGTKESNGRCSLG